MGVEVMQADGAARQVSDYRADSQRGSVGGNQGGATIRSFNRKSSGAIRDSLV